MRNPWVTLKTAPPILRSMFLGVAFSTSIERFDRYYKKGVTRSFNNVISFSSIKGYLSGIFRQMIRLSCR